MDFEPQPSPGGRIVEFLRHGGAWSIGSGRAKAREACIEFLTRVPEDVREFILQEKSIVVVAPPRDCPGMSMPYQIGQLAPAAQTLRFCFIYLDQRLEKIPTVNTLVVLAKCIANALQARAKSGAVIRTMTPEVLLEMWGFSAEVAKAGQRNYYAVAGMNISELVN